MQGEVMIKKKCNRCKKHKTLGEFALPDEKWGLRKLRGTSDNCLEFLKNMEKNKSGN